MKQTYPDQLCRWIVVSKTFVQKPYNDGTGIADAWYTLSVVGHYMWVTHKKHNIYFRGIYQALGLWSYDTYFLL